MESIPKVVPLYFAFFEQFFCGSRIPCQNYRIKMVEHFSTTHFIFSLIYNFLVIFYKNEKNILKHITLRTLQNLLFFWEIPVTVMAEKIQENDVWTVSSFHYWCIVSSNNFTFMLDKFCYWNIKPGKQTERCLLSRT